MKALIQTMDIQLILTFVDVRHAVPNKVDLRFWRHLGSTANRRLDRPALQLGHRGRGKDG